MNATAFTSRKVLLPLATLLAAGAVAVGSGATWTSSTDASVAVTSGELIHTNSEGDSGTLTIDNIIPGDSLTGTIDVTNTGDVDSTLDIAVSGVDNSFSDYLTITVLEGATQLYDGPFEDLAIDQSETDTDVTFDVGDTVTYTFTVALDEEALNDDQNQSAGATFTWTQTQVDGTTVTDWFTP